MSELRQIEGSNNGVSGVFEWIVDEGNVTHRRFIPGAQVTGLPNQIPKNREKNNVSVQDADWIGFDVLVDDCFRV